MDSPLLTYGFLSAIRSILRLCLCFFGEIGCLHPTEVHPTGGSLRVFRQFAWLEVGSVKKALSRPAWIPEAIKNELQEGRSKGYDVPDPADYPWLNVVNPKSMPSEWLALEYRARIVLLDDMLARRTAQVAGLQVWG